MKKLKLFFACLLMAVLSIGQMWGAEGDTHDFAQSLSQLLNNNASITGINIDAQTYPVKEVIVSFRYNKTIENAVTMEVTVGGTSWGTQYSEGTGSNYTTRTFSGSSTTGAIAISFTNNTGSGTSHGTFYVNNVQLVEGPSATPADPCTVTLMDDPEHPITEESAGAGVTLPSRAGCDGYTFAGWTKDWTAAQTEWTTTAPTIIPSGDYAPAADENLYPVYTKTEEGGSISWVKLTSNPQVGDVVLLVNEASSVEAKDKTQAKYITTESYTGTPAGLLPWTLEAGNSEGTFSFKNGDIYLNLPSASNELRQSTDKTDNSSWTISVANDGTATITNAALTARVIKYNSGSPRFACYESGQQVIQLYKQTSVSTTSYISVPSCCEQHNVIISNGILNGTVSADPTSACEGATVTLTFEPELNYHLSAWTLNGTTQDVAENTFSMPNEAVTISATFVQDACDPLATPVVAVSGKAYPYNAVKLAWSAITNADSYKVYIYDAEDNELEHNDAVTGVEYTIGQALSASTTYKYSVQAVSNTPATYCPSEAATSSFVTEALPTAHLTLIDPSGTHASSGDYAILTPFNLPTTAAACSKEFRGWDEDPDCATAPHYAKGAEFTFPNTTGVTLYAVYADELTPGTTSYVKTALADIASGSEVVVTELYSETIYAIGNDGGTSTGPAAVELAESATDVLNVGDNTNIFWVLTKDGANFSLTVKGGTDKLYCTNTNNGVRVGTNENNVFSISSDYIFNNATSRYVGYNHGDGGLFRCYTTINTNINGETLAFYKKTVGEGTYGNYSTACVASPTAEPASASIAVAAAGGEGTLGVSYENVNLAGVEVALFNNEACTEAFDGGWLTASIAGDDKHIAYTAQANTTSYVARTAYIKLTAPETSGAADPAVVVIPVTQAKYIPVFANLAALVEANLSSGTDVTVSFANEVITDDHYISQGAKRAGVMLTTTAGSSNNAIEIFYNKGETVVPSEWIIGGSLSATAKTFTWTLYGDQWELVPLGTEWTWENGDLVYTAPKAVSSVVITGAPSKTTYVDGEKFAPAGLTVTVNYSDATSEVNPVGVTFACDPVRVAKSDNPVSVSVVATFNEVDSDPFEVTGLTVGDIQPMSIEDFIAAGGARCYLEGTVSNIQNSTYGNFDLTDASGTIYVYGCLTPDKQSAQFNTLGVSAGDKVKVIAEDYEYYQSTTHEAKNVVFVSKVSPIEITITSAATVEKGKTLNLTATTDPAAGAEHITYSIKSGSESKVSLSGAVLTGVELGEATIIASIPDGEGYIANSVEFTVEVIAAVVHGSITYEENGGSEVPDVADATNLPDPLPTTTKEHCNFAGWFTDNTTFENPVSAGDALTGDIILYAKWTPLPEQAYTYTSNVVLSAEGGTEASTAIVKFFGGTPEFAALKAGTKNGSAGVLKVTVPAQTETLHFHAYGWNGENVQLTVTAPAGVTVTPSTAIAINANSGIANSSPFTLSETADPEHDAYYAVSLSGNDDEIELTISATSGKRFVLFGVNQEGGLVPVLDHIVVTGDASNKTYDAGDRFDKHEYAGLGANAIYTLADVEQEPVAIPAADIEWSSDPEVVSALTTSVTVTASYGGKQASKEITGLIVNVPDPEIEVSASSLAFGKVAKGASVTDKTLDITLKSVENATLAISGAGASAFSLDKDALTATGTVTVSASSANIGTFEATLTISDDANQAEAQEVALSITVEAADDLSGTWNLVTDEADLMPGMQVIIASIAEGNSVTTMGKQAGANEDGNNRVGVTGNSVSGTVLTPAAGTKVFTLVDAGNGKLAFQGMNGKYLYAASSSANHLKEQATNNANGEWSISIEDNVATITAPGSSNRNLMRFNPNNGNPIFACYATNSTTGTLVTIYAKAFDYEREIAQGVLSTTCLPNGGVIVGASIFEVAYMDYEADGTTPHKIYFDEVEGGVMEAGMPYVVLANEGAEKFGVYYTDSENKAAQSKNGLVGYIGTGKSLVENDYFIYNNMFYYVSATDAANERIHISNNRAYINLSAVPGYNNEPLSLPAPRRRVSIGNGAPKVATGMDELNASETPVKMIIDGKMYILRGEKMFDATGRLVK